jgi:cytochrome c biogenesis protein CcmG, thiol:disulfide interchange protein DsbE
VYLSPHPQAPASSQSASASSAAQATATPQAEARAEVTPPDTPAPADTPTPLPIAAREGALAPDFTFNDVHSTTDETLWALRGHPVWINFWATWCQPCAEEMPYIKEAYDAHKADGLRVLAMNESDGTQRILDYIKGKDFNWTFAVDWDLDTSHRYGVTGIPVHVFVDRDGVIRTLNAGEMAPGAMETALQTILAK